MRDTIKSFAEIHEGCSNYQLVITSFSSTIYKITWPPLRVPIFFTWSPLEAVIFWLTPPPPPLFIWITINARSTSLESFPPESMASLSYSFIRLIASSALLSFYVNVLAFLSVGWPALRGLVCCKQCLTLTFTFSPLLLFKCCFSPWWFKYLFSSGKRSFSSLVTSSHSSV